MTVPTAPSPYPGPGEIVGESWMVEKLLGEGGMGCVARAYHTVLHTPVALKFMNPQFMTFPGAVERFINEGKASGRIKSDHVVPVMDAKRLPNGTPYLVMECLDGLDLADLLARDGTPGLPVERSIHFVLQVLRGLQAAHAIGIIHRDMKPSNCFVVNKDGEEDFIKILDFGISKVQQPGSASLTQTNSALGTPLYMSPEQARSPRDVDARSDLYSVGVILYELLTGHTPFFSESGEFTEILFKLFTADPPPVKSTRPDLSDEFAAVVHRALARETPDRYATAVEMATALLPYAAPHSRVIVDRMRAFKAPSKGSIAPPEVLPPSMVAFSQLDRHTDMMANRPTTDVQAGAPVTELMARGSAQMRTALLAPDAGAAHGLQIDAQGRVAKTPAPGRREDAIASTQFDPAGDSRAPKAITGASTDLGASRDAAVATAADGSAGKRSPLAYVLPAMVVLGLVGGGLAIVGLKGKPSAGAGASSGGVATATLPSGAPVASAVTGTAAPPTTPGGTVATGPATSDTTAPSANAPSHATVNADAGSHASTSNTGNTKPNPPPVKPPVSNNPTRDPGFDPGIKQ